MKHHLNRQRQRNVVGLNNPADVTLREVKRGDNSTFEVIVCDDFGSAVELDATLVLTDFRITAKVAGALGAESAIVSATSYTKSGTGTATVYTLAPSFNGTALGDLFPTGGTQSLPADAAARLALTGLLVNAVVRQVDTGDYYMLTNAAAPSVAGSWTLNEAREDYVDLAAEFEYILDGKQVSYPTFTLRVWDDVSKGNETTSGASPVASAFVGLALTAFTGGGATALDGLDITGFAVGSIVQMVATAEGALSAWRLTAPLTITANTLANPTIVTSTAHGLAAGTTSIVIGGSNSTPTIDGARTATYIGANTFSVPVNVTVAGTTGYFGPAENAAAGIVRPDTNVLGRYWVRVAARGLSSIVTANTVVVTNSDFYTDVPGGLLAIPLPVGVWDIEMFVAALASDYANSGSALKFVFTGTATQSGSWLEVAGDLSTTAGGILDWSQVAPADASILNDDTYTQQTDASMLIRARGRLTVTGAGIFKIQMAQWSATAAHTVSAAKNSFIKATAAL